ncbi:hypothetical protein GCM10009759_61490 [Kitasatospora saccharophila]|uniref:Uncharacterized protein n=1 Tax=Kitasatospora saccharophila TaxID=407973 RepID=A0ABN2XV16_9ACTN
MVCARRRVTATSRTRAGGRTQVGFEAGRLLWGAGPTGRPALRHDHTRHEAGREFLRTLRAVEATAEQIGPVEHAGLPKSAEQAEPAEPAEQIGPVEQAAPAEQPGAASRTWARFSGLAGPFFAA